MISATEFIKNEKSNSGKFSRRGFFVRFHEIKKIICNFAKLEVVIFNLGLHFESSKN